MRGHFDLVDLICFKISATTPTSLPKNNLGQPGGPVQGPGQGLVNTPGEQSQSPMKPERQASSSSFFGKVTNLSQVGFIASNCSIYCI